MFYKKTTLSLTNIKAIPDNSEINIRDLIKVADPGSPVPMFNPWISADRYKQVVENGELKIALASKIKYVPCNLKKRKTAFLVPRKYRLIEGDLEIRQKEDPFALFSFLLSVIAIIFTGLTYIDQKTELIKAKMPVWVVSYDPQDQSLMFKSPSSDFQLQEGFVIFPKGVTKRHQRIYMPEMKLRLKEFISEKQMEFDDLPRMKDSWGLGDNIIYQSFAIATKYTYKGEVRFEGAIYRLFIDSVVPKKIEKNKKVEIIIRGVSFVRFTNENESLENGLKDVDNALSTDPELYKLLKSNP